MIHYMESINAESFVENCYEIFERVSFGEKIKILTEYGDIILVPKDELDNIE